MPKARATIEGGTKGAAKQGVEATVTGIEQIERFEPNLLWREVLESGARDVTVTVAPGGAVLLDPAQENIHIYPKEHRALALHIPRRHLVGAMRQGENLNAVMIPAENEALRLLTY